MTSNTVIILVAVAILAVLIILFYIVLFNDYTYDRKDLLPWQKDLVRAVSNAGEDGVLCERFMPFREDPFQPELHCYSVAIGVRFFPKTGWCVFYKPDGQHPGRDILSPYSSLTITIRPETGEARESLLARCRNG